MHLDSISMLLSLQSHYCIVCKYYNSIMFFEINVFKPNKIDLCVKRSEVNLDHHLKESGSTRVPDAANQISRSSAVLFWKIISLSFLPHMGMAAILAMWLWTFKGTFAPRTMEALHNIWRQLAQWLLRRCLKMLTTDGLWLRWVNKGRCTLRQIKVKITLLLLLYFQDGDTGHYIKCVKIHPIYKKWQSARLSES